MNFRKQIISVVLILVLIFLSSKIIVNAFENAAMNVLKSKKFNTFLINQIEHAKSRLPDTDFDKLIRSSHTWKI